MSRFEFVSGIVANCVFAWVLASLSLPSKIWLYLLRPPNAHGSRGSPSPIPGIVLVILFQHNLGLGGCFTK